MANLTLNILQYVFPCDTVWSFNRSEIVGYSISKNLHFVIDDGMCVSEDGTYLLNVYRPTDEEHFIKWLPSKERKYSLKYLENDKIFEKWINFNDISRRMYYKSKIEIL
jgi:hypothetical protein